MDNNATNDAVAARRRALAEALRTGEPVIVTPSGEVEKKDDAMDMACPASRFLTESWHKEAIMAYYWYQSDPQLYQMEVAAMQKFFPSFTINQLQDGSGRLYWRGKVQPTGAGGMVRDIMLIYKNSHPHVASANEYGGTVQILPLSPRLKDIAEQVMPSIMATYNNNYDEVCRRGFGLGLPHIYRDQFGRNEEYFICTADPKYFKGDMRQSTSAASALSWACKWIILCEMWLNGEVGDDVAMEGNY